MNIRRNNKGGEEKTMTLNSLRETLDKHIETIFLFTTCIITTILISVLMNLNTISPDEAVYLHLGKSILTGEYPYSFQLRPP